ncbi:hypothetical protein ABT256_13205, partial [Amycolatopsis japonica]
RTPDPHAPRTPDTHTGPSRGPGQTGPGGRPNQPQPVARGNDFGPGAQPHTGTPGAHGPGNRPGGTGPGNTGPGGRGPGGHSGPPHSPDGHGPGGHGPRQDGHPDGSPHDRGPDAEPDRPLTPDEVNQRHSEGTPAGSSYHRGDSDMGDLPHRVQPDPDGRYTVDVHVTPDGHARIGNRTYTPEEFADILRRNGDYDGRPIRLIGCDAGSNDFARRLSRELDTEVMAPSKPAWTDSNGRVFSSDYEIGPDGRPRPKIPPNGEWDVHGPDGTARRASDDGFTPDTSHADKQDVDADSARSRGDGDDAGHPPYDDVPKPRTISRDSPEFNERFADWNRRDDSEFTGQRNRPDGHDPVDSPRVIDEVEPRTKNSKLDSEGVPQALRGEKPLAGDAEYKVEYKNGATTRFFTDADGKVTHVEATPGTKEPFHNPDLRYPLQPGTQYRVPNFNDPDKAWTFEVGANGKPTAMTGDPAFRGQNEDFRDQASQDRSNAEGKKAYKNHPDHGDEHKPVRWAGGHLAANEMGGPGEYINMHPQMAGSNSGNYKDGWIYDASWRAQEVELGKFADRPGQEIENYQVRMEGDSNGVPENVTMRWQEVVYKVDENGDLVPGPDGKPIELSRETKQRDFPNDPSQVNYGPRDRYKGHGGSS